jgi:predicted ATP-dependent endonuclease of OLD family
MRLERIQIQNFRSIVDPIDIDFHSNYVAIVGPNNVGKSNIIKALELFLRDTVDNLPFDAARDLPLSLYEINRGQTIITGTISIDPSRDSFLAGKLRQLAEADNQEPREDNTVRIQMNYYRTNSKRYYVFFKQGYASSHTYIGQGIKSLNKGITGEDDVKAFVNLVRSWFGFFHLPAIRDVDQIAKEWIIPEIKRVIFQSWAVGRTRGVLVRQRRQDFERMRTELQQMIDESATQITEWLRTAFPEVIKFDFEMPYDELEAFLGTLGINITDHVNTEISQKGSGVQNTLLMYLLYFVATKYRSQNQFARRYFIWAIEEPESFLHSGKQRDIVQELQEYSKVAQIVVTTHSPLMLNTADIKSNVLLKYREKADGSLTTCISEDVNHRDLWKPYRDALGLSLADNLFFGQYNIVVEGHTDKYLIEEVNRIMQEHGERHSLDMATTKIISADSASEIKKFLVLFRGIAQRGHIVGLYDNDGEGRDKARRLGAYFIEGRDYMLLEKVNDMNTEILDLAHSSVLQDIVQHYSERNIQLISGTERHQTSGRSRFIFREDQKMTVAKEIIDRSTYRQLLKYRRLVSTLSNILAKGQLPLPLVWCEADG